MKRILLLGDSIRMGYEPYVRGLLTGQAHVLAPTENCQHSVNLALNFWNWVVPVQPDIIHFNTGLWDLRRITPHDSEKVIPLEFYAQNLRRLVTLMRQHTHARLLWASSTPVDGVRYGLATARGGNSGRDPADVPLYNAAAQAVMRDLGVPVNDLHGFVQGPGSGRWLSEDGIHYTPLGYERLAGEVAQAIRACL